MFETIWSTQSPLLIYPARIVAQAAHFCKYYYGAGYNLTIIKASGWNIEDVRTPLTAPWCCYPRRETLGSMSILCSKQTSQNSLSQRPVLVLSCLFFTQFTYPSYLLMMATYRAKCDQSFHSSEMIWEGGFDFRIDTNRKISRSVEAAKDVYNQYRHTNE